MRERPKRSAIAAHTPAMTAAVAWADELVACHRRTVAGRRLGTWHRVEERFPRPSVMGDRERDARLVLGRRRATSTRAAAAAAARRQLAEGAAIVDVGGESTRPGAEPVSARRGAAARRPRARGARGRVPLSIDTAKADVARRALELGAELVNDVTALRGDPAMAETVAAAGAALCLMHMQGEPRTMQREPRYDDVASEVAAFLEERLAAAVAAGIAEELVCLDPGIGFGKTVEQNFELVRRLDVLLALGRPVRRRLLAQELARQAPRRPRSHDRPRLPPASPPQSRPTSAGPRCFASTTSASTSRRSRSRGPSTPHDDDRARTGSSSTAATASSTDEREQGQRFLFDVGARRAGAGCGDAIDATVDYREVVGDGARGLRRPRLRPAGDARDGDRRRAARRASRVRGRACACGSRTCARPAGRLLGRQRGARSS